MSANLRFTGDAKSPNVILSAEKPCDYAYSLRISALTLTAAKDLP
jgi:hypothetical protein